MSINDGKSKVGKSSCIDQAETASNCPHLEKNSIVQSRFNFFWQIFMPENLQASNSEHHCEVDVSTIVLTGGTHEGMNAESGVFEYSGLGGENVIQIQSQNAKRQKQKLIFHIL